MLNRKAALTRLFPRNPSRLAYSTQNQQQTRISRLSNGVRVTTESTPGHFIGAGVYVDAGSRYETPYLRGATHLTDRMAFKVSKLSLLGPLVLNAHHPTASSNRALRIAQQSKSP